MSEVFSFIFHGILLTILIFLIHTVLKFFLIANKNFKEKATLISLSISWGLIIQYFVSGFLMLTGIDFLLTIIFPSSPTFPITITIDEESILFILLGAGFMIFYPIYEICKNEISSFEKSKFLSKEKELEIFLNFFIEYTRYKEKTGNPALYVIKFKNNNTILVKCPEQKRYFTKNLKFALQIQETIDIEGISTQIDSLEIADCVFLESGEFFSQFYVSNWIRDSTFQQQIQNLKMNQDLTNLKPFLKLKNNDIAEKFGYAEMNSYVKTHEKFKTIIKEN